MYKFLAISLFFTLCCLCGKALQVQQTDTVPLVKKADTTVSTNKAATDTAIHKAVKKFDPRIATRRSAMIPGWGQIYNKKYWKLPLVYGALGITAGVFMYNLKTYRALRKAYIYKTDKDSTNDVLIDPRFQKFSAESIRTNRNLFRQNIDYSALFFLVFWGLNVVDATVDGHLKQFDVNDNLTLHIKPGFSPLANTNGISLVMDIHSSKMRGSK